MNVLKYVDELIEQGYTPEQAEVCMEQMLMQQRGSVEFTDEWIGDVYPDESEF